MAEVEPALRIASWNIQRLGHRHDTDLARVAQVIQSFDLVAVQEVMTRQAAASLDAALPAHAVLLTDAPLPRDGRYREYYAFVYRLDRLRPTINTTVPDPGDVFMRDPFLGCFAIRDGGEICLLTIHVVFGQRVAARKAEILHLDDALRWAQQLRSWEKDWVVLGDFNRPVDDGDPDDAPEAEWLELLTHDGVRSATGSRRIATTLTDRGYGNPYDHIFVSATLMGRVRDAGRLDLVHIYCGGDFARCRRTLSDHAPVFVEIDLHGSPPPLPAASDETRPGR